ncbi:AAA family ATPase [Bradyrhizobium sp. 61]|uniref:AAA family ATPase n=1 Tax=Bradyrhizobium sp. 61 TaxID=2782679 RepID=UPI001FFB505E|nr:AAA family ATPase [Bradyrhizobium sp. 61]MCK1281806.1 AAA family ATPase [Bradyrhizobium sp. 61]
MSLAEELVPTGIHIERPKGPGLASLAGMDGARAFGEGLALDLKDYEARKIQWSEVDPGCVFYGPPGTGKTTLARAIGAECGVAFIATSFADWTSGSGGGPDTIARMKETFGAARKNAPCILFIDEIDALPKRGAGDHNASYFQTIVNGLLELIGSPKNKGVVVIAACNDPSNLDPALIRSGRLDQMIEIPLPAPEALAGIFKFHLGVDALNVRDLDRIALHCIGKSGADIAKIVRTARRIARQQREPLTETHLLEAITKAASKLTPEQLRVVAVHEAGHAAIAFRQGNHGRIIVSLTAGGTYASIDGDGSLMTRDSVKTQLVKLLAGRAAEEALLGCVSGGAGGSETSDLALASKLALDAIARRGLSARGHLMWYESSSSRVVLESCCGEEVDIWLCEASDAALGQIRNDAVFVAMIARMLLKCGTLTESDLASIDHAMKNIPADRSKSEILGTLGFAPRDSSPSGQSNGEELGA